MQQGGDGAAVAASDAARGGRGRGRGGNGLAGRPAGSGYHTRRGMPAAGGAGSAAGAAAAEAAAHERLIMRLERELGETVRRLEAQRAAQDRETAAMQAQLRRGAEERRELLARAELAEQRLEAARRETDTRLQTWRSERAALESRLAAAQASLDAARDSEKRIMAQATALEARVAANQAHSRNQQEHERLRVELEKRLASQAEQIGMLRSKLAELTDQLATAAQLRADLEQERDRLRDANGELDVRARGLEDRCYTLGDLDRQLKQEQERTLAAQESLQSAMRLNDTRERQIAALQEAVQAEKAKVRQLENQRREDAVEFAEQLDHWRGRTREAERQRVEDTERAQLQLRAQKSHVQRLTSQLASLEAAFVEASSAHPESAANSPSSERSPAAWTPSFSPPPPPPPAQLRPTGSPALQRLSQHTRDSNLPAQSPPGTKPHRETRAPSPASQTSDDRLLLASPVHQAPSPSHAIASDLPMRALEAASPLGSTTSPATQNRVLAKVLSATSPSPVPQDSPPKFAIPNVREMLNESVFADPNASAVSEYIASVLAEGPTTFINPARVHGRRRSASPEPFAPALQRAQPPPPPPTRRQSLPSHFAAHNQLERGLRSGTKPATKAPAPSKPPPKQRIEASLTSQRTQARPATLQRDRRRKVVKRPSPKKRQAGPPLHAPKLPVTRPTAASRRWRV